MLKHVVFLFVGLMLGAATSVFVVSRTQEGLTPAPTSRVEVVVATPTPIYAAPTATATPVVIEKIVEVEPSLPYSCGEVLVVHPTSPLQRVLYAAAIDVQLDKRYICGYGVQYENTDSLTFQIFIRETVELRGYSEEALTTVLEWLQEHNAS